MMRKTLRQLASSVLSATTSSRREAARFASYSASNASNVFKSATAIGCPSPSFATRSRYRETISRPRLTRCSTSIALRHHLVCTLIQAPRRANDRSAIRDVLTRRGGGPKNRRRGVTERAGPAMSALLIEKPHFLIKNTAMPETIVRFPATGTIPPPPDELAEAGRELWTKVMRAYVIEETHAELLFLACVSADSASSMRRQIKAEGEIVIGSTGQPAAHPLIAAEGAAQKRVASFLRQLGLFSEPKRDKVGRPPNPFGGN